MCVWRCVQFVGGCVHVRVHVCGCVGGWVCMCVCVCVCDHIHNNQWGLSRVEWFTH